MEVTCASPGLEWGMGRRAVVPRAGLHGGFSKRLQCLDGEIPVF